MNYSWRYDINNGTDSFWAHFNFRFDDEELIHLRHGKRSSVIMGGDPWASGGHLESPPGADYLKAPPGALSHAEGTIPVELLIRSKEYFEFLEPATIELRIRNLIPDLPLYLDTNLNPDFGATIIYIRRPEGRIVEYSPIMCKLAVTKSRTLQPNSPDTTEGTDRYSESVFLSYGRYGYYFDQPGEYLIRALYQGPGDLLIPSNIHRTRVGMPINLEEDRLAQDFFSYEVGMSLYLRGSQSPHLRKGMDILEGIADRYKGTMRGAKVAHRIAPSIANSFFDVQDGETIEAESITSLADAGSGKGRASETVHVKHMNRIHKGDPKKALDITDSALDVYRDVKTKPMNIPYARLVELRSGLLDSLGQTGKAIDELSTLRDDLSKRGVNPPVLAAISNKIKGYDQGGASKKSVTKSRTRKTKKRT